MQTPRATYRLQFNEHFRLADALALVPYLHGLGISHVYASPLFAARPHSSHGYDVCDFGRLNPELGTEADLEKLVAALRERGMGLVVDIVPNHMGVGTPENAWWWDVLKRGRASKFAHYFDINWEPSDLALRGKVLLPVLGDACDAVLARGEISVEQRGDEFILRYFENVFPLAPESVDEHFSSATANGNLAVLAELLRKQHYLLADWREGDRRLNYRRFFAVSSLAAVRVEEPDVFDDVHACLKRWLDRGWLDGVRVDHPDGLRDPETYLRRLRTLAPEQWIVVEKILQPDESLSASWPVQGTTGYEFLNHVNGLFINRDSEKALSEFYAEFTRDPADAGRMVHEKKRLVLQTLFVTEVNRLTELVTQIASRLTGLQNFSVPAFRDCVIELAVAFPVYRSFVKTGSAGILPVSSDGVEKHAGKMPALPAQISETDSRWIGEALELAKTARPDLAPELLEFVVALLRLELRGDLESDFVARFQQLTGAVMAKGVEDTTFYCLNRFVSLNEVGGDPGRFGVSVEEFHEFNHCQQANWPQTMLTTSTHDTKRSEDVRARMNVLSEIPDEWPAAILRWSKMNERHRRSDFPDRNAEYLFYQTLVGAWPISGERLQSYMEKATREAKQHTDWNQPNVAYDEALKQFVAATLADKEFIADLEGFLAPLIEAVQINSLAQTLIKLTAPGVPDVYQGNELWNFSLVDPDNRRPVDFSLRQRLLAESAQLSAREVWRRRESGLPMLWLIQKTLALRAGRAEAFAGSYEPIYARGTKANHLVAFVRGGNVMTVVPRFLRLLNNNWQDTVLPLPTGAWKNEFTGKTFDGAVAAGDLFGDFPVALLSTGAPSTVSA